MSILAVTFTVAAVSSCIKFGSAQPSIVDVIMHDDRAVIRWEVQCIHMSEVTDILYGCSQTSFQGNNMSTVRHVVNRIEIYREKTLFLHNYLNGDDWKCVFKLVGVHYGTCVTEDSACVLINVPSFVRPLTGMYMLNILYNIIVIVKKFLQVIASHLPDALKGLLKYQHIYHGLEMIWEVDHVITQLMQGS